MIAIIDYGVGNLFSVKNAFDYLAIESVITNDPAIIKRAERIILPGVGAFSKGMELLKQSGLQEVILDQVKTKPLLGICLGMQFLFDSSTEFGISKGLGLIPGVVKEIPTDLKLPHMGYNQLLLQVKHPLLNNIQEQDNVYFVHSYMAFTDPKYVLAYCDYDCQIPAIVYHAKNVYGTQFHPEKSGETGLTLLKNFVEIKGEVL